MWPRFAEEVKGPVDWAPTNRCVAAFHCPWNRYAWVGIFVLRQFAGPGCGVLLDMQSRRKNDVTLYDNISVPTR